MIAPLRKIVEVGQLQDSQSEQGSKIGCGDERALTLSCGHTYFGMPTTMYKVGWEVRCTTCRNEGKY